jgi:tRNA modification GTPase
VVWTKGDLLADRSGVPAEVVLTSGLTGEGLDTLRTEVIRRLTSALETRSEGDMVTSTAVRCRESLTHVRVHLALASEVVAVGAGDELVASHLHAALDHLGQIVGVVYTDDLLDRIFSRFCIGK